MKISQMSSRKREVIVSRGKKLERHAASDKRVRRKPLIPIIGWLFSKKKGSHEDDDLPLRAN
ncbi:hypothetical protein DITRI_Ditri18aG0116400 [Diplodiscus trichospermus]